MYSALRTGELAAATIVAKNPTHYARAHRRLYAGRLWINALARVAVEHPRFASKLLRVLPNERQLLRLLTTKVVRS